MNTHQLRLIRHTRIRPLLPSSPGRLPTRPPWSSHVHPVWGDRRTFVVGDPWAV